VKKSLVLGLLLGLSTSAYSASLEEAQALFNQRGNSKAEVQNAQKAADMVAGLDTSSRSDSEKALLNMKFAEFTYFVGTRTSGKNKKKAIHEKGYTAAKKAINLLSADKGKSPKLAENTSLLAEAHYFYAINLGKWGEANGVLSSLSKWPELERHLDMIDGLDKTVQDYGSNRTRSRALHKLPFGSKDDAEALLQEAFENTFNEDFGLSRNSTTVFYYLDILVKNNKAEKFCEVADAFYELSDLDDEELLEYNADKLPETLFDLNNFVEGKEFEEKVDKYYDRNC
jgi:hypothetical protein